MTLRAILVVSWLICLCERPQLLANENDRPKLATAKIDGEAPSANARVVKCYVDKANPGSDYETGSLHILYDDTTEVIEKLVPKEKSAENNLVMNQEGFSQPEVAEDQRTIAWTEQFDNCCTSYSIPLVLAIYRSGKNIVEIQQGLMVWNWMFLDGGKRIAAVWGPVHFSDIGDYQLYDTETGRLLDEVMANAEVERNNEPVHGLGPDAPAWAKLLENEKPK